MRSASPWIRLRHQVERPGWRWMVTAGARARKAIAAARAAGAVTVAEVLDGHVVLELECLDRVYLNGRGKMRSWRPRSKRCRQLACSTRLVRGLQDSGGGAPAGP